MAVAEIIASVTGPLRAAMRICHNPNHALVDGSPLPHEIGSSCMAETGGAEKTLTAALAKSESELLAMTKNARMLENTIRLLRIEREFHPDLLNDLLDDTIAIVAAAYAHSSEAAAQKWAEELRGYAERWEDDLRDSDLHLSTREEEVLKIVVIQFRSVANAMLAAPPAKENEP